MTKYILSLVMLTFLSTGIFAQNDKLNQLFDRYEETEGVTSIKIAKPMFSMLGKLNIEDGEMEQIKPLLSKINGLKILVIEKPDFQNTKGADSIKIVNHFSALSGEISKAVSNLRYEELVTVNSKGNKIKFLASDASKDVLDNLLLSVISDENTVLMMLDGKISMDDINKLINEAEKSDKKSPKK